MTTHLVPFETECERLQDGSVRVAAHGELDLATASALGEALEDCTQDHPPRVVVDLSDVPFMDASGLRVLLLAHARQREAEGDLVIAHPSRPVRRLLAIAAERAELPIVAGG
jgi:anti-anti-sigma factor